MRNRFVAPLATLFDALFWPWRRMHLRAVHIGGATAADMPDRTPLLFVANHVSWWDGFLLRAVQRRLRPDAALVTVMSAAQLDRFPFFRWLGAIGVDPTSIGSTRAMLRALADWRSRRQASLVVAYFPQGRIWPSSRRPLGFRRGVAAVASHLAPVCVVPIALHIEPLASAAPHAFVLVGDAIAFDGVGGAAVVERHVTLLLDQLRDFVEQAGEDAPARWCAIRPAVAL